MLIIHLRNQYGEESFLRIDTAFNFFQNLVFFAVRDARFSSRVNMGLILVTQAPLLRKESLDI